MSAEIVNANANANASAKVKKVTLSAKYTKFLVFGHWLINQLNLEPDNLTRANDTLRLFESTTLQNDLFESFFNDINAHTKLLKNCIKGGRPTVPPNPLPLTAGSVEEPTKKKVTKKMVKKVVDTPADGSEEPKIEEPPKVDNKAAKLAEKEAKEAAKLAEKEAKEAAKLEEKAAKEAAKLAEKEAKLAEKAAKPAKKEPKAAAAKIEEKPVEVKEVQSPKVDKEAAKLAKEAAKLAEKAAKEAAKLEEKAAKEAAKLAEKQAKEAAKPAKKQTKKEDVKPVEPEISNNEEDDDEDTLNLRPIQFPDGKSFLLDESTNMLYDPESINNDDFAPVASYNGNKWTPI